MDHPSKFQWNRALFITFLLFHFYRMTSVTAWETNQNTEKKQYQVLTFAVDALIHLKNDNRFCKNVHFLQVTDSGNIFSWDKRTAKIHLHTGINRALQSRSVYTIHDIWSYVSFNHYNVENGPRLPKFSILIILYRLMLKKQRSLFCDPDDLVSVTQLVKCVINVCHSHLSGPNLYNSSVSCRKDGFTVNHWNVNINIMCNITCVYLQCYLCTSPGPSDSHEWVVIWLRKSLMSSWSL